MHTDLENVPWSYFCWKAKFGHISFSSKPYKNYNFRVYTKILKKHQCNEHPPIQYLNSRDFPLDSQKTKLLKNWPLKAKLDKSEGYYLGNVNKWRSIFGGKGSKMVQKSRTSFLDVPLPEWHRVLARMAAFLQARSEGNCHFWIPAPSIQ